ncbi:Uncharacterised protein [Yersinia mollaretii]|nr:Uncharacterised protein [Yersinia mollaretii]
MHELTTYLTVKFLTKITQNTDNEKYFGITCNVYNKK